MFIPQRPKIIPIDTTNAIAAAMHIDIKKKENEQGIREIKRIGIFALLTEKGADGKFILPFSPDYFKIEVLEKQELFQHHLNKCANFAETLNNLLDTFLELYFIGKDPGTIHERYVNLKKLDFMGARNLLSEVIKKIDKKFQLIDEINTKDKLDHFTSTFYDFIMDRNKFTHGLLFLYYPSLEPILQYENEKKEIEYAEINLDIINDAYKTYEFLNSVLYKIYDLELNERAALNS